jgi:hypothetical protein
LQIVTRMVIGNVDVVKIGGKNKDGYEEYE